MAMFCVFFLSILCPRFYLIEEKKNVPFYFHQKVDELFHNLQNVPFQKVDELFHKMFSLRKWTNYFIKCSLSESGRIISQNVLFQKVDELLYTWDDVPHQGPTLLAWTLFRQLCLPPEHQQVRMCVPFVLLEPVGWVCYTKEDAY